MNNKLTKTIVLNIVLLLTIFNVYAQNGQELWLRNKRSVPVNIVCVKNSPTLIIAKQELQQGWQGKPETSITLIIKKDKALKDDGFRLGKNAVEANTDIGILYGVYELLRRQQTSEPINNEVFNPSYERRILDHWDNLNGTIERGYAGHSIFWRKDDPFTVTDHDKTICPCQCVYRNKRFGT
jgi:alpha-glucuronidase